MPRRRRQQRACRPIPVIAGQHPQYSFKQLTNFKAEGGKPAERPSPVMNGIVAQLSPRRHGESRAALRRPAGEAAQRARCRAREAGAADLSRRHHEQRRGGVRVVPRPERRRHPGAVSAACGAARRNTPRRQLKAFRAGERANDPNRMMRAHRREADRPRDPRRVAVHPGTAVAAVRMAEQAGASCDADARLVLFRRPARTRYQRLVSIASRRRARRRRRSRRSPRAVRRRDEARFVRRRREIDAFARASRGKSG